MFLVTGILLLIISAAMIFAIAFTTVRTVKDRGELIISKKNLIIQTHNKKKRLLQLPQTAIPTLISTTFKTQKHFKLKVLFFA